MEEEREAEIGETLTKAMHINVVTPCVEIGRFDAQLFHTKIRLALSWNLGAVHSAAAAAPAQRPGSRQVLLLKQPPTTTSNPSSLFFFSCEF